MTSSRFTIDSLDDVLEQAAADGAYSAAVVLVTVDGRLVYRHATGDIRSWDAPGVPAGRPWAEADASTRFDLASVTKPIVAAALLAELEARSLEPDLPVAELLDEFRDPALRALTLAQLLTHTAGFPAEWADRDPDPDGARFRARARPTAPPDAAHRYSCVGYIWAGFAAEALADAPLDEVVRARVLDPLGMAQTTYRPEPALRSAIAATEFQPGRGLVHGEVHDETAWALGGVVGNAGLFGTAGDLLRFAESLRTGGHLDGRRLLSPAVATALVTAVPLPSNPGYRQAFGTRLDEHWMRGLGPRTAGHTGFTGTGFVTEPGGRRSVVFLTNRVHPTRSSTELHALRGRVVDLAAGLGGTA
ncbi:serine hydrolase domain-containing protein [Agromyces sp. H66]|uniref:serine hydrolase domain-containing protein n=1 Tax=Agromyces sp. H66 TaxID=2529859 RepID=UPI00145A2859|nr:serine hydrolase domain-containing protein [Agromyces sp. H66]